MNSAVRPTIGDLRDVLERAAVTLARRFPGSRWRPQPEAPRSRKSRVFPFREQGGTRRAALRVYDLPRAAEVQAAALRHGAAMPAAEGFAVPELYAEFPEAAALLIEWVPEMHLERVLVRAAAAPARHRAAQRRAGEWLRRFHALGGIDGLRFPAARYAGLLEARIERAPAGAASLAADPLWRRSLAAAERRLARIDGHVVPSALTHGDFTSTNILVGPTRVTGIDLWAEHRLPVAEDLARMFVYLAMGDPFPLRARLRPVPLHARRAQQALLAGYGGRHAPEPELWSALVTVEALARWLALTDRLARRGSLPERWKCNGLRALLATLLRDDIGPGTGRG